MFRKYLTIVLLTSFVFFLFVPISVRAAIVPCATSENNAPCTLCHLVLGIKNIIDFGLKIVTFVAIAALVIAGILYIISAGSEGLMQMAKGLMTNVFIGFALVLGAFLIVNVAMWLVATKKAGDAGGTLGIQATSWYSFTCRTNSSDNSE